jgi:hypothetical protein
MQKTDQELWAMSSLAHLRRYAAVFRSVFLIAEGGAISDRRGQRDF